MSTVGNIPIVTTGLAGDIGLMLDVTGAFFLAASFVLKKPTHMLREATNYMDGNPFLLPSAVRQALEARVGFVFLFFGFMGQFVADTRWVSRGPDYYPSWLLLVGIAVFVLSWLLVRIAGTRRARRKLAATWGEVMIRNLKNAGPDRVERIAGFYGDAFSMRRRKDESWDEFHQRLVGEITQWRHRRG